MTRGAASHPSPPRRPGERRVCCRSPRVPPPSVSDRRHRPAPPHGHLSRKQLCPPLAPPELVATAHASTSRYDTPSCTDSSQNGESHLLKKNVSLKGSPLPRASMGINGFLGSCKKTRKDHCAPSSSPPLPPTNVLLPESQYVSPVVGLLQIRQKKRAGRVALFLRNRFITAAF